MKTLWSLLFCILGTASLFGQDSTRTGYILYTHIIDISESSNFGRRRPPDMPDEITQNWELYFSDTASYYSFKPEDQDDGFNTGGMSMRWMRWEPKDVYYADFTENIYKHYTEFMTKAFLIEDQLSMEGWKMTGKQGIVMGYPCMEASKMSEDSVQTIVWFTPRIRVKTGPGEYMGLPGAVLYVNIDDGKQTITATQIRMGALREESPEIPDEGEEVSQSEYDEIVKEKTEEMRRLYGR